MKGSPALSRVGISLLLVDDDVELGEMMEEFFAGRGIALEVVHDGRSGLARALGGGYDLLLLDVMMPGLDGFELLRQLRRSSQIPVIMLTARTAAIDRISGLEAGADDYLPKPFGPEELVARIRAVLRRAGRGPMPAQPPEVLEVEDVQLIPSARAVRCAGAHGERDHHRVRHPGATGPLRRADRLPRRADGPALPAQGDAVRPGARRPRQPPAQEAGPSRRADPDGPRGGLPVPHRRRSRPDGET